MLGIEKIRRACPSHEIPSHEQLPVILQILKSKVKDVIRAECATAAFVNIALDGWSDPMGRHYQGITLRIVQSNGGTVVYLAAMKSTLEYESADVLQSYLRNVVRRYKTADKLLSICTDRGAPNLKAVRNDPPVEDFFG
jgi:hypothetical protein